MSSAKTSAPLWKRIVARPAAAVLFVSLVGLALGVMVLVLGTVLSVSALIAVGLLVTLPTATVVGTLGLRWLVGKLLWRVGRRLLVSYFLVGVLPPLLMFGFLVVLLWILAGQLAALRVESALLERARQLQGMAESLDPRALSSSGAEALPPELSETEASGLGVAWATAGGEVGAVGPWGVEEILPERTEGDALLAVGRVGDDHALFAYVVGRRGRVLIYERLEPEVRRRVEEMTGVAVSFPQAVVNSTAAGVNVTFGGDDGVSTDAEATSSEGESTGLFGDSTVVAGGGLIEGQWVYWLRALDLQLLGLPGLEPASDNDEAGILALVRSSLGGEYRALFGGRRGMWSFNQDFGKGAIGALLALALVAVAVALVVTLIAGFLALRIARATQRLYRGFEEVERGNFAVRAKLGGDDQLASLVAGFNRMVEGLSTAIEERAERDALERELQAARELQRSLLPPLERQFPGFDLAVDFEPAAAIGGDFYDLRAGEDGSLTVQIGDVSGHGLGTGIVMAAASSLLRSQDSGNGHAAELFEQVDRQLREMTDARTFVTLMQCRLEPRQGRAVITNAGHLYPYRVAADGSVFAVENPSRPLGLRMPTTFRAVEAPLAPADRWVFLSDGLVEASGVGGELFGFERLEATLASLAGKSARELRDGVLAAWRGFVVGDAHEDDRTLIVVALPQAEHTP